MLFVGGNSKASRDLSAKTATFSIHEMIDQERRRIGLFGSRNGY